MGKWKESGEQFVAWQGDRSTSLGLINRIGSTLSFCLRESVYFQHSVKLHRGYVQQQTKCKFSVVFLIVMPLVSFRKKTGTFDGQSLLCS